MPRLMSVSLTEGAVHDRVKFVTRRMGWRNLTPGTELTLCRKVMGRRKGEPLVRIADVEVVDVRRERLDAITAEEVRIEGFPDMTPEDFVEFFCRTHKGCTPDSEVTRIRWRYLSGPAEEVAGEAGGPGNRVQAVESVLADMLDEYARLRAHYIRGNPDNFHELTATDRDVALEVATYRNAANLIRNHRDPDAGMGLPSWLWDEWASRGKARVARLNELENMRAPSV